MDADVYDIHDKGRRVGRVGRVATLIEDKRAVRGKPSMYYLPIRFTPARGLATLSNPYPNGTDADCGL